MIVHIKSPNKCAPHTGIGTTLTTDSGEEFKYVKSIQIDIAPERVITATVELHAITFDVDATAKFTVRHPITGEVKEIKSITFADDSYLALSE